MAADLAANSTGLQYEPARIFTWSVMRAVWAYRRGNLTVTRGMDPATAFPAALVSPVRLHHDCHELHAAGVLTLADWRRIRRDGLARAVFAGALLDCGNAANVLPGMPGPVARFAPVTSIEPDEVDPHKWNYLTGSAPAVAPAGITWPDGYAEYLTEYVARRDEPVYSDETQVHRLTGAFYPRPRTPDAYALAMAPEPDIIPAADEPVIMAADPDADDVGPVDWDDVSLVSPDNSGALHREKCAPSSYLSKVSINTVVFDFYALDGLAAEVPVDPPSMHAHARHERFMDDLQETRSAFHDRAGRSIRDYLILASAGEVRHAVSHGIALHLNIPAASSRHEIYAMAHKSSPASWSRALVRVFEVWPKGAYGGPPWRHIAEWAGEWGTVKPGPWMDHAFDLEHNGGCVFNKAASFTRDQSALHRFQNWKRDTKNLAVDLVARLASADGRAACGFRSVGAPVVRLYQRAEALGYVPEGTADALRALDVQDYSLPTIPWGSESAPEVLEKVKKVYAPAQGGYVAGFPAPFKKKMSFGAKMAAIKKAKKSAGHVYDKMTVTVTTNPTGPIGPAWAVPVIGTIAE